MSAKDELTEEDVMKLIVNPIYVGFGPYPKIIDDDVWIKAARRAIREIGYDNFFKEMLIALRESFGGRDA